MAKQAPVLGSFGKGVDGSCSLNFCESGGTNCDRKCALHPDSINPLKPSDSRTLCYAVRTEIRPDRKGLKDKLERHAKHGAAIVCGRAIFEIQERIRKGKPIPWLRISTNGSVPNPEDVTPLFKTQFTSLLSLCNQHGIPVHFPVETESKAQFYRALVGDLAVVRESFTVETGAFIAAKGAASATAGTREQSRKERVESARELAKSRRDGSGRKCIVCPAITNSWASNPSRKNRIPSNPKAKCGACKACSQSSVDIVYPLH